MRPTPLPLALTILLAGVAGAVAAETVTLTVPGGGSSTPPRPVNATVAKSETTLLAEDFESSWPVSPWRVEHAAAAAAVDWGRTEYRSAQGGSSIWCAGGGSEAPEPGGTVPALTESWAIVGPYDLSTATSASLSFDLWLETEAFNDLLMWLVSTNGVTFQGEARSTDTDGWHRTWVDLTSGDLDVAGEAHVWIAFVYRSDRILEYEGAYVDNVTLVVDSGNPAGRGFTYTDTEDFELGTAVGLELGADALELGTDWSALPYLWVPSPVTGTVSKVDTATGAELARYRTGPELELEPSPVTVALDGSCWVGNRAAGTVVKIGLESSGSCVDRNADDEVDTSRDENGDQSITGNELLDWGEDECVLLEVLLVEGREEVFEPGEEHGGYARTDVQALAVDADNNLWVGVPTGTTGYRLDGATGAILETLDLSTSATAPFALAVDRQGNLWWSSWPDLSVLRVNPTSGEQTSVDLPHGSRGIALDQDGHLLVSGFTDGALSRVDIGSGEVAWTVPVDWQADGVAVTSDAEVWVASPGSGTVKRYTVADGRLNGSISLLTWPTALAVDGVGKVWVAGSASPVVQRVDPATNRVELDKELVASGGHDTAGDLTGIIARTVTTRYGTWSAVHDTGEANVPWGTISWLGSQPEGTETTVRVRTSPDEESWSAWEVAENGVPLGSTPAGRYLQVEVAFKLRSGETSPILDELTVSPIAVVVPPVADFSWTPETPATGEVVLYTDLSTGSPSSWAWDFGDGTTSDQRNPNHPYASPGTYNVVLEVANQAGSDSESKAVVVVGDTNCLLDCAAEVPANALVDQGVLFTASATPSDCSGEVAYAWDFGDGTISGEQNPTHPYAATGTYHWVMEASIAGVSCSRNGEVVVTAETPQCTWTMWVPVVSHAPGAAASAWRSDLGLLGSGTARASVELRFHGPGGLGTRTLGVDPGEMVDLVDLVEWVSPGVGGSGALEVCSDGPLAVTSRTYNQLADDAACLAGGTLGQDLAGTSSSAGMSAGEVGLLPQLRENAAFRSNLGFTNTGSEDATLSIGLHDAAGAVLVVYSVDLEPGQWWQDSRPFRNRAGQENLNAGWARVEVLAGNGVVAYASVVDNITNDPTTVPLIRAGENP